MKDDLRQLAEQLRASFGRVDVMPFPASMADRKSRIQWLTVALFCEMHDVAESLRGGRTSEGRGSQTEEAR